MTHSKIKDSEVFISINKPLNQRRLVNVRQKRVNFKWLVNRTGFTFK